jgi:hypothetical protein
MQVEFHTTLKPEAGAAGATSLFRYFSDVACGIL